MAVQYSRLYSEKLLVYARNVTKSKGFTTRCMLSYDTICGLSRIHFKG